MKILVTGAAGFIGCFTAAALLERGYEVSGLDNLNAYYDPALKRGRLKLLTGRPRFTFHEIDISDRVAMEALFARGRFDGVIHLAAQAGVRYSLENPHAYIESNIAGFMNVLEGCRRFPPGHLVYASSSSVYGANAATPFNASLGADHPVSLYGATKKANEMMAHAYSHLYGIPATGLRFFTVYGPWGRPDMSPFLFLRRILAGEPVDVFNYGDHARDFTYIDDIVDGVIRTLDHPPAGDEGWSAARPDPASSSAPHRLYNLGNSQPEPLLDFIRCIEKSAGRKAILNLLPMQPGDVVETYADIAALTAATGFRPKTPIEAGVPRFVEWYRGYYAV